MWWKIHYSPAYMLIFFCHLVHLLLNIVNQINAPCLLGLATWVTILWNIEPWAKKKLGMEVTEGPLSLCISKVPLGLYEMQAASNMISNTWWKIKLNVLSSWWSSTAILICACVEKCNCRNIKVLNVTPGIKPTVQRVRTFKQLCSVEVYWVST